LIDACFDGNKLDVEDGDFVVVYTIGLCATIDDGILMIWNLEEVCLSLKSRAKGIES
jgi:hypothetical protein